MLLLLFFLPLSCSSAPESRTPPAETPEPREGLSPDASGAKSAFYNLTTPAGIAPVTAPDPSGAASSSEADLEVRKLEQDRERQPTSPPDLEEVPYSMLVAEIQDRIEEEWIAVEGGLGSAGSLEDELQRGEVAGRLIAVSFLVEERSDESVYLPAALAAAGADETRPEERLLAAAYLARDGESAGARKIFADLFSAADSKEARFDIVNLTFARHIDGPGQFIPATEKDLAPRKAILVYGEFKDYRAVEDQGGRFRSSFSASFRLVSPTGSDVDCVAFLPEDRGSQISEDADDVVNFWARYKIPADLEPGEYRLIVEANDILGGKSASKELKFQIHANHSRRSAGQEAPRPAGSAGEATAR